MKNKWIFLALLIGTAACQDDAPTDTSTKTVVYEVITDSGNWFGSYTTETGENYCICGPPLAPSGWRYSFEVSTVPFELHVDATVECCADRPDAPDVTTNIYVDGKLVVSNTSNWAPGVASADYTVR
ncbi:MAG: hypothetical protein WA958_13145 [Tunicatimonas sp.]